MTTTDLQSLRDQHEAARLAAEIAELEQYSRGLSQLNSIVHDSHVPAATPAASLHESNAYGWGEGFGPYVGHDPFASDPAWHYSYHDGHSGSFPIDLIGDREHGQDRPIFQNETDLARIRGVARYLVNNVPPATGVLRNLVNYVIGTEWAYEATAKDDADINLADSVSGFLEEWIEHNAFVGMRDRELYRRMVRDGGALPVVTPERDRRDGMSRCRIEEDAYLVEPAQTRELERYAAKVLRIDADAFASDWGFGVHTPHDDHESILGFHVTRNADGSDWDYIPEQRAEYFRSSGGDRNVKRGVSEFWPVERHLRKGDKVFTATADGSEIQARIAWIRELAPGHQRSFVTPVDKRFAIPSQSGTRTASGVHYPTPVSLTVPSGQKYHPGPMGSQRNPNLVLAGQAVLRLAGVRWNMPEWMTSGDASNNNFASSLTAESPFVKSAKAEQFTFKRHAVSLLWKAIRIAHTAGRFGDIAFAELRRRVILNGTPPQVETRDPLQLAQRNTQLITAGVMSRRTAAQEAGFDFDEQVANMEQDGDAELRQAAGPQQSPAEAGALFGALNTAESMEDVRAITESMLRRYP